MRDDPRRVRRIATIVATTFGALVACKRSPSTTFATDAASTAGSSSAAPSATIGWVRGLPEPPPSDAPASADLVALGQTLFFDKRLARDDFMACADCHRPDHAWTSDRAKDPNALGRIARRNAPSIANAAYASTFAWDGAAPSIEAMTTIDWKSQLGGDPAKVVAKLAATPAYVEAFARASGGPASEGRIVGALAAFVRAQRSGDAPWDRYVAGDASAIDALAIKGAKVFERRGCGRCHGGALFTDGDFHAVGIDLDRADEERDHGRMDVTKRPGDDGRFRTPSLRDVARNGPYFHDGSVASLDDAIRAMASADPKLDEKLAGKILRDDEVAAIRAFLEALSGTFTLPGRPRAIAPSTDATK